MVSGRPLLYLSLPGVAFILGVFWFRRRNKNRLTSGGESVGGDTESNTKTAGADMTEPQLRKTTANAEQQQNKAMTTNTPMPSKSMNINGTIPQSDEDNPLSKLFGKSAPIQIVQNGGTARGSPLKSSQKQQQQQQQQQIDSEVLKTKIQDAGQKVLRSIDEVDDFENMSSPVDLPDSVNTRVPFYVRTVSVRAKDEPVVIKATRTPKISPENSFLESKYTKECDEPNNNCQPAAFIPEEKQQEQQQQIQQETQQETQQQSSAQSQLESAVVAGGNEKRNVDTASPALSLCSVQSADSGKGSSLPRSEATRGGKTTYEFFFPNLLIGQLYGRKRSFINQVKAKTGATVLLRKKMYEGKVRICAVEGTEAEVHSALVLIRQRMPTKRYPNFTMQRVHFAQPQSVVPLSIESRLNLQLSLIEGINNDVVVSAVISGSHIFVQHPLHPSHPSLAVLQKCLYDDYTQAETPLLPGYAMSAVCVLSVNGIWYRVQIVDQDVDDEERCVVKFLDFGGYMNVPIGELRQIRSDFMSVPFQATECLLSNIVPTGTHWLHEAADILCKLTKGIVLQAQVVGYNSQNIPEIYLFACVGPNKIIFINKELAARKLALWID